jgi:hypothetical protein
MKVKAKFTSDYLKLESHALYQYEITIEDLEFHLVYCNKVNDYIRSKTKKG